MKNTFAILSLLAAFFVPVLSFNAAPQSQTNKPTLTGTLTDPSGAPVSRARITAQSDPAHSGRHRRNRFPRDGTYSLVASPGHATASVFTRDPSHHENPRDPSGETRVLNFSLELEPLSAQRRRYRTIPAFTAAANHRSHRDDLRRNWSATARPFPSGTAPVLPGIASAAPALSGARRLHFPQRRQLRISPKCWSNGTPINPRAAQSISPASPPENIDKVEIVHGAENAIYGATPSPASSSSSPIAAKPAYPPLPRIPKAAISPLAVPARELSGMLGGI